MKALLTDQIISKVCFENEDIDIDEQFNIFDDPNLSFITLQLEHVLDVKYSDTSVILQPNLNALAWLSFP